MKKTFQKWMAPLALFCLVPDSYADTLSEQIKSYSIISDFEEYPSLRKIGDNLFWPYRFESMQADSSHLASKFEIDPQDIPITLGGGLLVQHLNRGRVFFLEGKYHDAARIWRSAAVKFRRNEQYYRRLNFFTALAYMKMLDREALAKHEENSIYQVAIAANLISDALADSGDQYDPLLDRVSPKYFYYLSTLYYLGGDVGKSAIAAKHGVNSGSEKQANNYRSPLRFLLADTYIQNRDYLMAAQQLDAVIREKSSVKTAMRGFEKLGDLYASLYNFRLALEFYNRAATLQDSNTESGLLFAKIGEAKFWLGDYAGSAENIRSALEKSLTPILVRQWAQLRLADIALANKDSETASVAYFDLHQSLSPSPAKELAHIRNICLDLPQLFGSSRNLTIAVSKLVAQSDLKFFGKSHTYALATSCFIASLLNDPKEYIQKINAFYRTKPNSLFIGQLAQVSRNIQREKVNHLLANNRFDEAIRHYEAMAPIMYKEPSPQLARGLFRAYVAVGKYPKAKPFYERGNLVSTTDQLAALDYVMNAKDPDISVSEGPKLARELKPNAKLTDVVDFTYIGNILQAGRPGFDRNWFLSNFRIHLGREVDCQFLAKHLSGAELDKGPKVLELSAMLSGLLSSFTQYEKTNPACLQDIADIEYLLYEARGMQLGQIYLKRSEKWWKVPHIVDLAWQIAESVSADDHAIRRDMFKKVVEYATPGTLARTYASNQLQDDTLAH